MIRLDELQREFKQFLMEGDKPVLNHPLLNHVVATREVGNDMRLSLYANAYQARLVEALETDYKALEKLLGEPAFIDLAHAYIRQYPSRYYSLRWFGQHLEVFLRKNADYIARPHLAELACIEWTFVNSFDAADAVAVSEQDIARVPMDAWPALKAGFHPSVKTVSNQWNSMQLWRAAKDNHAFPPIEKLPQMDNYLIWRHGTTTQYRYLDHDEFVALRAMINGGSFVAMCEALASCVPNQEEVPMRAASLLKAWLAGGLVCSLKY